MFSIYNTSKMLGKMANGRKSISLSLAMKVTLISMLKDFLVINNLMSILQLEGYRRVANLRGGSGTKTI